MINFKKQIFSWFYFKKYVKVVERKIIKIPINYFKIF